MVDIITGLDSAEKRLIIDGGSGSRVGDAYLYSNLSPGVHLIALGRGSNHYDCPLMVAVNQVRMIFNKQEQKCLEVNEVKELALFDFDMQDIVTFATPNDLPGVEYQRLDFIKSKGDFFGIRTRHDYGQEQNLLDAEDVIWVCGPDNHLYAEMFGPEGYNKRRELFGKLYETALATDPVQMANPIFPGERGLEFITRGKQNNVIN